ncbi:MAG: hypothetical protein ISS93_02580 [Candidatus Aenigmarchaeota archaeon]|nr:hypothetical protein [Candidatus Aenigmarchaeota archaeon]
MEFLDKSTIKLDKVENELDRFVLDFVKILEKHTKYVIISGYVAILFGRNRASEDVDVFVNSFQDFEGFVDDIQRNGYWIVNEDPNEALSMLKEGLAIRVAKKGAFEPNFEIKFPKRDTDFYSLENTVKVILKSGTLYIGSLELNIAFKLFLSSEKDIEDARFLFKLLKDNIDKERLEYFVNKLEVRELFEKYLL